MAKIDELSLDHIFKKYLDANVTFQNWILSKTKFKDLRLELVIEKIWHQRWYRDPVTKKDSETYFSSISGSGFQLADRPAY
jgi:hypothetical protein